MVNRLNCTEPVHRAGKCGSVLEPCPCCANQLGKAGEVRGSQGRGKKDPEGDVWFRFCRVSNVMCDELSSLVAMPVVAGQSVKSPRLVGGHRAGYPSHQIFNFRY